MELLQEDTELTPEGHDVGLLREMLALSPEERIQRNVQWVALIKKLRAGLADTHEPRSDLSDPL